MTEVGECDRLSDAVPPTYEIFPVYVILQDFLEEFFEADVYWDLMPFMSDEPQVVVPIQPSRFSRGGSAADRGSIGRGRMSRLS